MFKAGFDYSWQEASFAVCDDNGRLLLEECKVFPPRNASGLPGWLSGLLARKGLKPEDISEWSVGCGPGSFTGLRVAASFVMGLGFGRDIRRRGSPYCAPHFRRLSDPELSGGFQTAADRSCLFASGGFRRAAHPAPGRPKHFISLEEIFFLFFGLQYPLVKVS